MNNFNKLDKCDYIFVDLFDFLLNDKDYFNNMKKCWCNHIIKYFQLKISINKLYEYLKEFDNNLNYNNYFCYYNLIYNDFLNDIYNKIDDKNIDYNKFVDVCYDFECNYIKNNFVINKECFEKLYKLKTKEKKIYCILDRFFKKININDILADFGILDLFDDIYYFDGYKDISSFYDKLFLKLNISNNKCIICSNNNLYSLDMDVIVNNSLIKKNDFSCSFTSINIDKTFLELSKYSNDNFEHIIFSFYTFIERLYYELLRHDKDEVVFLSREGEFLKKIFDIYVSKINNKKINSKYLLVSRKATYLPSLNSIKFENFNYLFSQYPNMSGDDFLKSLNFDDGDILDVKDSILLSESFDFKELIFDFSKSSLYKAIVSDECFRKKYEFNRVEQKRNFKKYVRQVITSTNFSVVDVGWNGSIQDNIKKILGSSYTINGYYFGLEKRDINVDKSKNGLVFSNIFPSYDYKLYNVNRAIYEVLLGASHGSANKYVCYDNTINVLLFSLKEEEDIYNDLIYPIQCRMISIFERLCDLFINNIYDNNKYSKKFNKIHFKMMFKPNEKQVHFINNIYHYENFGIFDFTTFNSKKSNNLVFKLKEYKKFFFNFNNYFNDFAWPILKLCNYNMRFGLCLYSNLKFLQFWKNNIL